MTLVIVKATSVTRSRRTTAETAAVPVRTAGPRPASGWSAPLPS